MATRSLASIIDSYNEEFEDGVYIQRSTEIQRDRNDVRRTLEITLNPALLQCQSVINLTWNIFHNCGK